MPVKIEQNNNKNYYFINNITNNRIKTWTLINLKFLKNEELYENLNIKPKGERTFRHSHEKQDWKIDIRIYKL